MISRNGRQSRGVGKVADEEIHRIGDLVTSAPFRIVPPGGAVPADVVHHLRQDILSGTLQPKGRLKFEELRNRYEASVASLREALLQLASEGLVRSELNRGFSVAPVSLADFLDITELRIQLEVQALADSIKYGDEIWEAEIVASLHLLMRLAAAPDGTRSPDWPARHRRFHRALVGACRSPWLLHFRDVLFDQAERYRSLGRLYRKSPRDVGAEHKGLADLALARETKKAVALAESHIRSTVDNVIRSVPGLNKKSL